MSFKLPFHQFFFNTQIKIVMSLMKHPMASIAHFTLQLYLKWRNYIYFLWKHILIDSKIILSPIQEWLLEI